MNRIKVGIIIFVNLIKFAEKMPSGTSSASRMLSSELLAKLQADKLTGPKWTRFLVRFLPNIFADTLRDNPGMAYVFLKTQINFIFILPEYKCSI
jgi:hypothetical protein